MAAEIRRFNQRMASMRVLPSACPLRSRACARERTLTDRLVHTPNATLTRRVSEDVVHNGAMPRPTYPLLSRKAVVETAVRIIDSEGLAACSLPRLARELDVKAPSLYYHFDDRADIMAEVARYIVRQTPIPRARPGDWIEWFVGLAVNFRRTILRHPNAAQVLLEFVPRDVLSTLYDNAAQRLQEAKVPAHLHVMILDGIEALCLGSGLVDATRSPSAQSQIFPNVNVEREPTLAAAVKANRWRTDQKLFAEVVRTFLIGVITAAEAESLRDQHVSLPAALDP